MSVQFLVSRLFAVLLLVSAAAVQAHEMGNELVWLAPAASPQPRLAKEPRLYGGSMPAGNEELRLIEAAKAGQVKEVKEALGLGARANAQDGEGRRPLHAAVAGGHREVVRLLLKAGADPDASDRLGHNALDIAVLHNQEGMVDLLLRSGADPERRNGIGNTPLITALLMEREGIARELVQRGARLDVRSGDKRCIGELAAAHASEALLNLILEQGGSAACR